MSWARERPRTSLASAGKTKSPGGLPPTFHQGCLVGKVTIKGGPDLVLGPQDDIISFANLGLIQAADTEFNPDDFVEQTVTGALWNGHYWGVPNIFYNHLMLFYNKNRPPPLTRGADGPVP